MPRSHFEHPIPNIDQIISETLQIPEMQSVGQYFPPLAQGCHLTQIKLVVIYRASHSSVG